MIYGVKALRLSGQRLGIGRYIEYLLRHWVTMLTTDERVIVFVREPVDLSDLELSDRFEVRLLPSRMNGVLWETFVLARRYRDTDVLFNPSYTIPLGYRGRTVVATHSVNRMLTCLSEQYQEAERSPAAPPRWRKKKRR